VPEGLFCFRGGAAMVSGEAAIEIVFSIAAFPLTVAASSPTHTQKNPLAPRATILLTYPSFQNLSLPHFFQILDFIEILSKNLYVSSICIFVMILFQFWSYSGISEEFLKSKMADPT